MDAGAAIRAWAEAEVYGGAAVGAGIAAGIIGGAIIADQARRSNAVEYCMSRFRSYNPDTGTYFTSRGEERPCP